MRVNVVFVIRCLSSAVSLTLFREQRVIRIICCYIIIIIIAATTTATTSTDAAVNQPPVQK